MKLSHSIYVQNTILRYVWIYSCGTMKFFPTIILIISTRHALVKITVYVVALVASGIWSRQMRSSKKTIEIIIYVNTAFWTIENPATSLLWKRSVAQPFEQIAKTSYCRYGYSYRKHNPLYCEGQFLQVLQHLLLTLVFQNDRQSE